MTLNSFIQRNINKYPLMEKLDIYKLIFQVNFLVGHLVDYGNVRKYLDEELLNCNNESSKYLLYEYISDDVVRVNIIPFLKLYSKEYLIDLFYQTSKLPIKDNFSEDITNYRLEDIYSKYLDGAPSHSAKYRNSYHPHYRVVASRLLKPEVKAAKLQTFIESIRNDQLQVVALEGRCGSGKSTISKMLENVTVIELDDHFDSINDPINLDYLEELLSNLRVGEIIKEKCYDCRSGNYYFKEKVISNVVVLEGVYGYLPRLRKYINYLGYVVIDKKLQLERIKNRSNVNDFIEKWIPREEEYFSKFNFIVNADVLI